MSKESSSPTSLLEIQLQLESTMKDSGAHRFLKEHFDYSQKGRLTQSRAGAKLLDRVCVPFANEIAKVFDNRTKYTAGKYHNAYKHVESLGCERTSFIVSKVIIDGATQVVPKSTLVRSVGNAVHEELRAAAFDEAHPGYWRKICNRIMNTKGVGDSHLRHVIDLVIRDGDVDFHWEAWPTTTIQAVGYLLLELFMETTGFIQVEARRSSYGKSFKTKHFIHGTESLLRWIREYTHTNSQFNPALTPMVVEPRPWVSPVSGGYWSISTTLLKTKLTEDYLTVLDESNLSTVYTSINTLQNTPWRVHKWLLNVAMDLKVGGDSRVFPFQGGLDEPLNNTLPLPQKPHGYDDMEHAQQVPWKKAAVACYESRAREATCRLQFERVMGICKTYKEFSQIYFPYQLDFRGRVYAMPMFLNPQGADWARGFLEFANGAPLGDRGAYWLAVHVANTYGHDKVSFDERAQWVLDNEEEILKAGENPHDSQWWREADKPWQHLSACRAWYDHCTLGDAYVCHLPCAMDGSCNGLQHLSAILRDEVGGASTNLIPADTPADIYGVVSQKLEAKIKAIPTHGSIVENLKLAEQSKEDKESHKKYLGLAFAAGWLQVGIDRSLTKRPTMILPYGGTQFGMSDYVKESLQESGVTPWGDPLKHTALYSQAASWLSEQLWDVLGEVVIAARLAMDWLQKVSKVCNGPLWWTTPAGLPVRQWYPATEKTAYSTYLFGKRRVTTLYSENESKVNKVKMSNSFSPNFIHSLDAAALMLTVEAGLERGITHWSMIHDSYAVLPHQVSDMQQVLRNQFVRMYTEHDVLQEVHDWAVKAYPNSAIPPVPPKGNLNLNRVKRSKYFFA